MGSAGIGRTGTFCALDSVLSHPLAWSSREDLVLEVVKKFRDQRNDMVETFVRRAATIPWVPGRAIG